VGVREKRIRGARPFARHVNIIVLAGPCSAQDVADLSLYTSTAVEQKFQLRLEREVRLL